MRTREFTVSLALTVTVLVAVSGQCLSQRITGLVADASDSSPLPGVNVFISGTTFGAATDSGGTFAIDGVPPGVHELVASMVGYGTQVKGVKLSGDEILYATFRLHQTVYDAGELVVTSERPKNWRRHFKRFEREFLGTSPNAEDCEIGNPYVLAFWEEAATGTLRASASRPLIIENRALGYRVTFVLQDFEVSSWNYSIRFKGQPRFEELEPADDKERSRWTENREVAYAGSFPHFLFSLARGQVHGAGYDLRLGDEKLTDPYEIARLPSPILDSMMVPGMVLYEKLLYSPTPLHVTYRGEKESRSYRRFVTDVTGVPQERAFDQHSVLKFAQAVTLHTSGYLYEPYLVTTYGYWIWERVADMLPRNYGRGASGFP